MWKRKLNWKNDSIEFTFQDQVVSLEESILDDEMWFKASMKNGNQIKKVELRMTINTVHEENNNPVKAEEQEFDEFEQPGSFLNPIKLEEDSNELTDAHREEIEDFSLSIIRKDNEQKDNAKDAISRPSGGPTAAKAADIKKKLVDIQGLGNNNVTIKDGQLIDQPPNHAEADTIARARKLIAGDTKLGNGSPGRGSNKDITFDNDLSRDDEDKMIEEDEFSEYEDGDDNNLEHEYSYDKTSEHNYEEGEDNSENAIATPSGGPTAAKAADIKQKVVDNDIQGLGNKNVTIKFGQLIDQPPNIAEADTIARKLIAGDTKLGNGSPVRGSNKDITFDNNLSREREYILAKYLSSEDDDEDGMIEEAFKEDEASEHECEEGELNVRENLEPSHTEGGGSAVQPDETDDSHPDDQGGFVRNLRKRRKSVDGSQSASQPCSTSRSKRAYTFDRLTKKYRCRVCNKEFNLAETARQHNRSIHMGIRYPCTSCGKTFMRPGGLRKHTKIEHKGV